MDERLKHKCMKIGIIREGKIPPDTRVPLNPAECAQLINKYGLDIVVEPSDIRCFSDAEYMQYGLPLSTDLCDREILLGVKEVPIDQLIPEKTYFFFSHTIKKQPYNRKLLQAILEKRIRLIDYEVLTDENGHRIIAFGRFAGMVGAHNALYTYGRRTGAFELPRLKDLPDYKTAVKEHYSSLQIPPVKIVLTGTGRVANGSAEVLRDMGIAELSPEEFLSKDRFDRAVFTQISSLQYVRRADGKPFTKEEFYREPETFVSNFERFYRQSDIFINGIFWKKGAPAFFSIEEMNTPDFRIRVIADVTCDIAPEASIPATIKPTTIDNPIFGFDPRTGKETTPHQEHVIDMMTIDNLPNELARDASTAFGAQFVQHVVPELLKPHSHMLERATIAENGQLGRGFGYLRGYVEGG